MRRSLTTHEGDCAQCLLHEDLGDGWKVVMGVVRHHDSCKQDGHYSCRWEREREFSQRRKSNSLYQICEIWPIWISSAPTGQFDAFGQAIGKVRKDYHHAKLQWRSLPQVKVLQKLICELGNKLLIIITQCERERARKRERGRERERGRAHCKSQDTRAEMSPVRVPRAAEPKNILRK